MSAEIDRLTAEREASYRVTRIHDRSHELEVRWSRIHGVMVMVSGPPGAVYVGAQWRDLIAAVHSAAEWPSLADPGWTKTDGSPAHIGRQNADWQSGYRAGRAATAEWLRATGGSGEEEQ